MSALTHGTDLRRSPLLCLFLSIHIICKFISEEVTKDGNEPVKHRLESIFLLFSPCIILLLLLKSLGFML